MPARPKKASPAKASSKRHRPLQPDIQRRDKWQRESISDDGTLALEFHLAQATVMTPAPSIDQVVPLPHHGPECSGDDRFRAAGKGSAERL